MMSLLDYPRRLLACALGVASPSRVGQRGFLPAPCTWLDRWERRIDDRIQWPPIIEDRQEVQVVERRCEVMPVFHRVVSRVDVTGRSNRATRRVLNRWRRRCKADGLGYEARLVTVYV